MKKEGLKFFKKGENIFILKYNQKLNNNKGGIIIKRVILLILIGVLILTFAGCDNTSIEEYNTLSGKPEVIIEGVDKRTVVNKLNDEMINRGYNINETSEYKLVYGKDTESILTSMFFGSEYDAIPETRITINIVEYEDIKQLRLIATLEVVTNPGSAFERTTDFTNSEEGRKYFKTLREIKEEIE